MNSQSVRMNLSKDGKEMRKVKVNDSRKEQGLRMHMKKRMWHNKRGSIQLDKDMDHSNKREVMVLVSWSVGNVEKSTLREIFHRIRVVGLRYISV